VKSVYCDREVIEIRRLSGIENFVNERVILYSIRSET